MSTDKFSYDIKKDMFNCYIHVVLKKEYVACKEIKEYFAFDLTSTHFFAKTNMILVGEYMKNQESYNNISDERLDFDSAESSDFEKSEYILYRKFIKHVLKSIPYGETRKIYHFAQQLKYDKETMINKLYDPKHGRLFDKEDNISVREKQRLLKYTKKLETYCLGYLLASGFFVEYDIKSNKLDKEIEKFNHEIKIKFQDRWEHFLPDCSIEICSLSMKSEKQWNLLIIEINEDSHQDRDPEEDQIKRDFLKAAGYEYIQINIKRSLIEKCKFADINDLLDKNKVQIKSLIVKKIKQLYNIKFDRDDVIRRIQSLSIETHLFEELELSLNNCYEFNINHEQMMTMLYKLDNKEMMRSILGMGHRSTRQLISSEYLKFQFGGHVAQTNLPSAYIKSDGTFVISGNYKIVTNLLGFIEYCINARNDTGKRIVINILRLLDLQQQLLRDYILKEKMMCKDETLAAAKMISHKEQKIIKTKQARINFIVEDDEKNRLYETIDEAEMTIAKKDKKIEKLKDKLLSYENNVEDMKDKLSSYENNVEDMKDIIISLKFPGIVIKLKLKRKLYELMSADDFDIDKLTQVKETYFSYNKQRYMLV